MSRRVRPLISASLTGSRRNCVIGRFWAITEHRVASTSALLTFSGARRGSPRQHRHRSTPQRAIDAETQADHSIKASARRSIDKDRVSPCRILADAKHAGPSPRGVLNRQFA
jgi:hypothetical protein